MATRVAKFKDLQEEQFKIPWRLMPPEFYRSEMARLVLRKDVIVDPKDLDFNAGGLSYFHGEIDGNEAEARLEDRNIEGAFLIRIDSRKKHALSTTFRGKMIQSCGS
eukprot:m.282473 g.282473  ORF g.282473 m.282473 type:complete len:107 (-) comp16337_c0_seq63:1014-1334(-)